MKVPGRQRDSRGTAAASRVVLPAIGSTVHIPLPKHDPADGTEAVVELPCQVQSVEQPDRRTGTARLVVTPPDVAFGPVDFDPSLEQAVLWTDPTGHLELPVIISAAEDTWTLTVTGAPRRVQRREFVRVNIILPTNLTALDEAGRKVRVSKATMIDLSEGGVRVFVDTEPPAVGSHVAVEFVAGMECLGFVVRHIPGVSDHPAISNDPAALINPKRTVLAIRFDDPEQHGDEIRRIVFAEQLRVRQAQKLMADPAD